MHEADRRLLAPFLADPGGSAILLDVDGTLAPIVPAAEDATVPPATLALVAALAGRYGLVGCVSGRPTADARRLVPVARLVFAGNHGLELELDGEVSTAPAAVPFLGPLRALAARLAPIVATMGGRVEDKGASLAIHFRQAPDPVAARAVLAAAAVPLVEDAGLVARWGRMVLEVLPPVPLGKGEAVARLLAGRGLARSLYAGDDSTDVDAFGVVDVAVAVLSPEAPPGLEQQAAIVVDGIAGVRALLALLASS